MTKTTFLVLKAFNLAASASEHTSYARDEHIDLDADDRWTKDMIDEGYLSPVADTADTGDTGDTGDTNQPIDEEALVRAKYKETIGKDAPANMKLETMTQKIIDASQPIDT